MELLSGVTKGDTQIKVVTGPVNSGKSLLLTKLMEELRGRHVPVLDINLRSVSFNSVDTLIYTLEEKMTS